MASSVTYEKNPQKVLYNIQGVRAELHRIIYAPKEKKTSALRNWEMREGNPTLRSVGKHKWAKAYLATEKYCCLRMKWVYIAVLIIANDCN